MVLVFSLRDLFEAVVVAIMPSGFRELITTAILCWLKVEVNTQSCLIFGG